jgi:hypothetical protein
MALGAVGVLGSLLLAFGVRGDARVLTYHYQRRGIYENYLCTNVNQETG